VWSSFSVRRVAVFRAQGDPVPALFVAVKVLSKPKLEQCHDDPWEEV